MTSWIVVEDEPHLYDVLIAITESIGVDGYAFANGEDAVAWIDDVDAGFFKGESPELAILDIRLPGALSGVDVAARLRRSPQMGNIAIVLITAWIMTRREERQIMAESGADMLMYKPLPAVPVLMRKLRDKVQQRRGVRRP
jgi:DNA-binding response OmpR family regulator